MTKHMDNSCWTDRIKSKLKVLRDSDRDFQKCGAIFHQYRLGSVMTLDNLREAEKHYKVSLPEDYREFLLEVGNGGAGPGMGLQRFGFFLNLTKRDEEEIDLSSRLDHKTNKWIYSDNTLEQLRRTFDTRYYDQMEGYFGAERDLSLPFPLTEAWSLNYDELPDEDELNSVWHHGVYGLALNDHGQRATLIVSGAASGTIWIFDCREKNSIVPCLDSDGNRVCFKDWYERWLDDPNSGF